MDDQNKIFAFLRQPENISVAIETVKHIAELRGYLHKIFWDDFHTALLERFQQSDLSARWTMERSKGIYTGQFYHISFIPKETSPSYLGAYIRVGIQQIKYNDLYYLMNYGTVWSKECGIPDLVSYRDLIEKSKKMGFPEKGQLPWWPTCKNLPVLLQSDEFLLQYGPHPKEFVNELADEVWGYFMAIEPELYQLNQDLFRASQ